MFFPDDFRTRNFCSHVGKRRFSYIKLCVDYLGTEVKADDDKAYLGSTLYASDESLRLNYYRHMLVLVDNFVHLVIGKTKDRKLFETVRMKDLQQTNFQIKMCHVYNEVYCFDKVAIIDENKIKDLFESVEPEAEAEEEEAEEEMDDRE